MIIFLPNHQSATVSTPEIMIDGTWDRRMYAAVSQAPAALQAVLHKMHLTLGYVDGLQVGDVLPLSGATVGSVRLFAPDDVMVGKARLGQSAGMRAVRIQAPPEQSCVTYLRRSLPKSRVSTKFDLLSGQVAHAFRQVRIRQIGSL
jgi:flagellar motor switch protein FliM